jgi:hypothetical protein
MRRLRVIVSMATLVASLPLAVASAASASSLLSGYGGPGQGNQAILGSALLNGPRGGSGSGGGSTGAPGSSQTGLQAAPAQHAGAPADKGRAGSGGSTAGGRSAKAGARKGRSVGRASGSAETDASGQSATGDASGTAAVAYPVSERGGGGIFGLSGMDLVYVLLVLGALALIGVFIRLLTGSQIPAEGPAAAKEM